MIKAVVFDLDDTLYLERDYVKSGFVAVDSFLQSRGIDGFFVEAWGCFENGVRGNVFNEALNSLNLEYDKDFIIELLNVYRNHKPNISLLPDSVKIISKLKNDYLLGLITDGYSIVQNNKLEALSLKNKFANLIVTDDLGDDGIYWKPHKKSYEMMQSFFAVPHESCLYIGDNVKKDFIMANKLGWTTVQICRQGCEYKELELSNEYNANFKIKSMEEIPQIILNINN